MTPSATSAPSRPLAGSPPRRQPPSASSCSPPTLGGWPRSAPSTLASRRERGRRSPAAHVGPHRGLADAEPGGHVPPRHAARGQLAGHRAPPAAGSSSHASRRRLRASSASAPAASITARLASAGDRPSDTCPAAYRDTLSLSRSKAAAWRRPSSRASRSRSADCGGRLGHGTIIRRRQARAARSRSRARRDDSADRHRSEHQRRGRPRPRRCGTGAPHPGQITAPLSVTRQGSGPARRTQAGPRSCQGTMMPAQVTASTKPRVSNSRFFGRTWPRMRGASNAATTAPARGSLPRLA